RSWLHRHSGSGHSSGGSWSWPQRCQSIHDTARPSAGRRNGITACKVLRVSTARSSRSSGQNTSMSTSSPDTVTCDSSWFGVPSRRWSACPCGPVIWSATHWAMTEPEGNLSLARNRIAIRTPRSLLRQRQGEPDDRDRLHLGDVHVVEFE